MTRWHPLHGRIPAMRGPCSTLRVATIRYGDYPSTSLRAGSEQLTYLLFLKMSNDLIHWVRFFLQGMAETATRGREVFQQVLILRSEAEHAVLGLGKRAANARQMLNLLYHKPVVSAADIEKALSVSTPTANALIRDFVNLGMLQEIAGQQRGRAYAFDRYLRLFAS